MGRPRKLYPNQIKKIIIENGGDFNIPWLMKQMECSRPTITKNLHELQDENFPIYINPPNGYTYDPHRETEHYSDAAYKNESWKIAMIQGLKRDQRIVNKVIEENERQQLNEMPMIDLKVILIKKPKTNLEENNESL